MTCSFCARRPATERLAHKDSNIIMVMCRICRLRVMNSVEGVESKPMPEPKS